MSSAAKVNLLIIGASGHGACIRGLLHDDARYHFAGYLDSFKEATRLPNGDQILGDESLIGDYLNHTGILGIGDNGKRKLLAEKIKQTWPDFPFTNFVHPSAVIAQGVKMGVGNVIMPGAIVNPGSALGDHCIINTKATVDHDCTLGDYVSLAPGATVGGGVTLGTGASINMGACVAQNLQIGAFTVVGAGAVVLQSVAERKLVFGVPAKPVRDRGQDEPNLG